MSGHTLQLTATTGGDVVVLVLVLEISNEEGVGWSMKGRREEEEEANCSYSFPLVSTHPLFLPHG